MSELVVGSLAGLSDNGFVIDVASGSSLDLSNGATLPAGSIINVQSVLKTDTFSASVTAGGNVAVTDLSITHEVSNASNKLIITAFLGAAATSGTDITRVGIAVHDGTSLIAVGDSAGSRVSVTSGGSTHRNTSDFVVTMPSVTFVHTPGAGSKTYTLRAVNINTATRTVFVNRSNSDLDRGDFSRAVSAMTIQEVAG